MSRPIPARLLIHECVLEHKTGVDRNRNPTYSETVLKRVRIGATFQTVRGNIGETKADTLTLVIDAKNTQYFGAKGEAITQTLPQEGEAITQTLPQEGDGVIWESKEYTVRSITPCFAQSDDPHHWEVTLE